jgi:hypothetical protein
MVARARGLPTPAADIVKDLDARESLRLRALYRDVSAEIAAARARGRSVDALQRGADSALAMAAPATRAYAFARLNELRLAIPPALDALRPSDGEEPRDSATAPAPVPSPAPSRRARSR